MLHRSKESPGRDASPVATFKGTTMSDTPTPDTDKSVPVAEAIKYRKRAQQAEQQVGDLQAQLDANQAALDDAQQQLRAMQRQSLIDQQLAQQDAIDLEAARLLIEQADVDDDALPDAVQQLRDTRPHLFRTRPVQDHRAMPAHESPDSEDDSLHAATRAARTGNPKDLLQYLRLRRQQ